MGNNRILLIAAGTCLMLATFVGCGGRSGEKDYHKAVEAWQDGDLVRARTHFEKPSEKKRIIPRPAERGRPGQSIQPLHRRRGPFENDFFGVLVSSIIFSFNITFALCKLDFEVPVLICKAFAIS